jgi:hypothetical protein
MNRGDRQHHERRVWRRRSTRSGWPGKHWGKTPGKPCSRRCCGNQRAWEGPTRQELLAPAPVDVRGVDDLHPAELRLIGCACDDCAFCHSDVAS